MDISEISVNVYLAIIPSILLCLYVYRMDVIEKEPLRMLFTLFFLGILITVPTRFVEELLLSVTNLKLVNYYDSFLLSFGIIAVVEETYKFLVLIISSWKNKNFDYKYDAIVYSVFISLGFATLENLLYIQSTGLAVAIWRGVISVPAHAFYAVTSGFFLGLAKEYSKANSKKKYLFLFLSLFVPIIIHGTFDFLLLTENNILCGVFFSFVAFLYFVSYFEIKKIYKDKKI